RSRPGDERVVEGRRATLCRGPASMSMRATRRAAGRRMAIRWLGLLAVLLIGMPSASMAQFDAAKHAQVLIAGLDFDDARRVLASADADDPRVLVERARLA